MESERDLLQQEIYQELSAKIDPKITEFKLEVKQGLIDFQTRVIQQLRHGLENPTRYSNSFQSDTELKEYLEIYTREKIQLLEAKYSKALVKISQEIIVLRFCILFFIVFFLIERLTILF